MSFRLPIALLAALQLATLPLGAFEIIAHRGASHDAPENTLASLKLGWEQGADACELDVYLSKDGQAVLLHDKTTKRTTGVDRPVVEQTLAELRTQDAGSWKGAQWAGEKIPTLAEALATIPDGKRMFIEIKVGVEILPELMRVMQASGKKPEQLTIICFTHEVVKQAKKLAPASQVYWLASPKKESKGAEPTVEELIAKAKEAAVDGIFVQYTFPIDAAWVEKVKAAGLRFFVWTVNDAAVAKRLAAAGVEGVGTDRPGWLREQLAK